jgi:hypothetical protein
MLPKRRGLWPAVPGKRMVTGKPPGAPSAKCGPASGRTEHCKVLLSVNLYHI